MSMGGIPHSTWVCRRRGGHKARPCKGTRKGCPYKWMTRFPKGQNRYGAATNAWPPATPTAWLAMFMAKA
jgi:hypothetical protein